MREVGVLITCDRCEKTEFVKDCKRTIDEMDNLLEYWLCNGKHDYCPNCADLYRRMFTEFMKEDFEEIKED